MEKSTIVSSADGSLKKIALDVLLTLYVYQRKNILNDDVVCFNSNEPDTSKLENTKMGKVLLTSKRAPTDIFNALKYLEGKGLVSFREDHDSVSISFWNIRVEAGGVDMIEGIGHDESATKQFNAIFNFKLADNITVESLIKAEIDVDSIFKASVL